MFIIVLGQHVSILIESSSGPSKIQILTKQCLKCAVGLLSKDLYLIWPEDDSIRTETCCPNTTMNIIQFCCVLTDTSLYIYIYIYIYIYVCVCVCVCYTLRDGKH